MTSIAGDSADPNVPGVHGSHSSTGAGVFGESEIGPGVHAVSRGTDPNVEGVAVFAEAVGAAVIGNSQNWIGVVGFTTSTTGGVGVMGQGAGRATGVFGEADSGIGVHGVTNSGEAAIRGEHKAAGFAGFFEGKVGVTHDLSVNGNITTLGDVQLIGSGQDLAEPFTLVGQQTARPGSVVVLAGPDRVRVSDAPYDPRVAGIVSGAGNLKPGIVLGRCDTSDDRPVIALTGKVWCYVDAGQDPIELGDLLTTSGTLGHAMRATDQTRAFGAVIGKALAGLSRGRGLIPVLVALR
jgi:hypothetical protein